jgi:hypothetical protein
MAKLDEVRAFFSLYQQALCILERYIDSERILNGYLLQKELKISEYRLAQLFSRYPRLSQLFSQYQEIMSLRHERLVKERVTMREERKPYKFTPSALNYINTAVSLYERGQPVQCSTLARELKHSRARVSKFISHHPLVGVEIGYKYKNPR